MEKNLLLRRLDEIGQSLEHSSHALALIGLGSVGVELERLDAYSDLDFFVIVEPGWKRTFLDDLQWLSALCPVAYCFPNTEDGYKLLFADGIFCEFAIFEPAELQTVSFSAGRIAWKRPGVEERISQPVKENLSRPKRGQEWLLGEALTNLYVGLAREKRGERVSAMRFIQVYAVDRLLELAENTNEAQPVTRDEFSLERRFEQRFPDAARYAPQWIQGYERNRESALAILAFLKEHYEINDAIAAAIRGFCM